MKQSLGGFVKLNYYNLQFHSRTIHGTSESYLGQKLYNIIHPWPKSDDFNRKAFQLGKVESKSPCIFHDGRIEIFHLGLAVGILSSVTFLSARSAFPVINPVTVPRSQNLLVQPEASTMIPVFLKVNSILGQGGKSGEKYIYIYND